jgi:hypothetical protein
MTEEQKKKMGKWKEDWTAKAVGNKNKAENKNKESDSDFTDITDDDLMTQEAKEKRSQRLKEIQQEEKEKEEREEREDDEKERKRKKSPERIEHYREYAQDMMEAKKRKDEDRRNFWTPWREHYEREDEEIRDWRVVHKALSHLFHDLEGDYYRLRNEVDDTLPTVCEELQKDMDYFVDRANQWEREHRRKPNYHEKPYPSHLEKYRDQMMTFVFLFLLTTIYALL